MCELDFAEPGALEQLESDSETLHQICDLMKPEKIEWLIHLLDLVDKLARSRGLETSTEAQDGLRKLLTLVHPF